MDVLISPFQGVSFNKQRAADGKAVSVSSNDMLCFNPHDSDQIGICSFLKDRCAVFFWRHAVLITETLYEIRGALITALAGDRVYTAVGRFEQKTRFFHSRVIYIFARSHSDLMPEKAGKMIRAHSDHMCKSVNSDFTVTFLVNISAGLENRIV